MDPGAIGALVPVVAILAFAGIKIAKVLAARPTSAAPELLPRLEELEETVGALQKELAETQERLDFAERLLAQARDEHRISK